jgi:hypothetical protein
MSTHLPKVFVWFESLQDLLAAGAALAPLAHHLAGLSPTDPSQIAQWWTGPP